MGWRGRIAAITHRIARQRSGRVGHACPAYPDIFPHRERLPTAGAGRVTSMRDSADFDALAARLDELARTCAQLAEENAGLPAGGSRMSGSLAAGGPEPRPG